MRKLSLLLPLLFAPMLACDAPSEATTEAESEDRVPLGKADNIGSCENSAGGDYCGGPSGEGNCWCDDLCEDYGDCCGDKPFTCDDVPAPADLCLQDEQCDSGFCDHTECLSNCPDGMFCPAVCWGVCGEEPEPEPQSCLASDQCDEDSYCAFESECGEGPVGTCEVRPDVCAKNLAPVCGCDAVTYGNACNAAAAGVSVQSQGECPTDDGPSCEGSCGGQADGCWCDELCSQFGDCCEDYEPVCAAPSCDDLVAAYEAETAEIRGCESDDECGQVLAGTSCGCTRNWVARTDADTSAWDTIRSDAQAAGCELSGTISTCDCPPADGFVCNEGTCGWNYL